MTQKERMLAGKLYGFHGDNELPADYLATKKLCRLYNQTTEEDAEKRNEILRELCAEVGKNVYIEPLFRCDFSKNIYLGDNFYANYDCIILDVCKVVIGDNVLFGPRVCIFAAGHPVDAEIRNMRLEFGKEAHIGNDVWVGGCTVINPGVKIGNNVIIGSGSVVTKDIPDNVIAVGNPCRVKREITAMDKRYWNEQLQEYKVSGGIL
ncbi:MAG: sugar O-acetyltransferase [Spirochaetaceae bacterium]|jgi:maltose O-acetyltransferase|nr:sugar O-acetyltransferase [Spirochaetaceae bacterium]